MKLKPISDSSCFISERLKHGVIYRNVLKVELSSVLRAGKKKNDLNDIKKNINMRMYIILINNSINYLLFT